MRSCGEDETSAAFAQEIDEMEELLFCLSDLIGVLNKKRAFCCERIYVGPRKGSGELNDRIGPSSPNSVKMTLACPAWAGEGEHRIWPVRPEFDHCKGLFI